MPMTLEQAIAVSKGLLHTMEAFFDTSSTGAEAKSLAFDCHSEGEDPTVRMVRVIVDGEAFLVVAKRVGGAP